MHLIVSLEHRFDSTPDGAVWTQTMFDYAFWTRYLEVFDHVRVLARVKEQESLPSNWKRADGPQVSFIKIPYYIGPMQYLLTALKIKRIIKQIAESIVTRKDAVIMRVGSQLAACLEPWLRRMDYPYGLEVVGDPHDVFSPGAVNHPFRPFFRWWFSRQLRWQCAHASAVAYVTETYLQQRYPAANSINAFACSGIELLDDAIARDSRTYTTHFSSIELSSEDFVVNPRMYAAGECQYLLINIGSMAQLYKGQDVLIKAVAICRAKGLNVYLRLLGDGKHRRELETLSSSLDLHAHIDFIGEFSAGQAVRDQLDRADLFVLPSRTEGLPRALIEAMARGLPCIGSTVGGIPELLPNEDMVSPNDIEGLAQKIMEISDNPERMMRMSARNLEKAKMYRNDILDAKRRAFYQFIKERTEAWLMTQEN